MRKCAVLILVTCLVASGLIVHAVTPVNAQAGYKPSVPEFAVKLIDNSYNEPPAYMTDPYTGETKLVWIGGYVSNKTIEVTIKSQPFTSYTNASGHKIDLYYIIEMKGYYQEGWGSWSSPFHKQFNSEDIVVRMSANNYEDGSQLEFRVKAVVAYDASYYDILGLGLRSQYWLDEHATSDYSSIKTLRIGSTSPAQTATFSPVTSDGNGQPQFPHQTQPPKSIFTTPFFTLIIGVLLGCVILAVVVLVIFRRQPKTSQADTYAELSPKLFSFLSILLVRCGW
jgi:hypothetical protein